MTPPRYSKLPPGALRPGSPCFMCSKPLKPGVARATRLYHGTKVSMHVVCSKTFDADAADYSVTARETVRHRRED